MVEGQPCGVQRLALERAQGGGQPHRRPFGKPEASAVHRVPHDRMAQMRQVQANLMGSAGLELDLQIGVAAKALDQPVVGDRPPPVRAHRHAEPVGAMPADGLIHGPASGHDAGTHGEVLALDAARHELARKRSLRLQGSGHDQQAAGVLVEPMDDPGARQLPRARIQTEQRILQRVGGIPGPRMHHQAGGLVHHEHVAILMDQGERNVLRQHLPLRNFRAHAHDDARSRLYDVPWPARLAGRPEPGPHRSRP